MWLRGCPTTLLTPAFVILSEAKNLMDSGTYTSEILHRLRRTQNDVVGQSLKAVFWHLSGVKCVKRQILSLFFPASRHFFPGALFETMGVTSDTAIAVA